MARKTKEEKEKTYHALLEAAAELFAKQGYAATTLNDISERAGMTRGAFYWHFSSKVDVIKAIWEQHALPGFNPITEPLQNMPKDDPAGFFKKQLNLMIPLFTEDSKVGRAMFIIMHNMELSEKEGELSAFFAEQNHRFYELISEAFEEIRLAGQLKPHVTTQNAALGCMCIFIGMVNKALLPFTDFNMDDKGATIFEHYLDGVLAE